MMTVHEVSELTGVSIRALHHYDKIGLLRPAEVTESGYRLYDDTALECLQHILLFKALKFSLKEIKGILDSPVFDRNQALDQQITLLQMQKEHLENLITLARGIKVIGVRALDFTVFDTKKIDAYAKEAKAQWGSTVAYQEFQEKSSGRTREEERRLAVGMMEIFAEMGKLKDHNPEEPEVQAQVKRLQDYISTHYYSCSKEILAGLGKMYAGGGSMTENIDQAGGAGTGLFAGKAIGVYCRKT